MLKATDREKLKKYGFIAGVVVILGLILTVILISTRSDREEKAASITETPSQEPIVRYVTKIEKEIEYVDKIIPVEVEKEITTDILEEGLQDMGFLVTNEYLFTEVTTFTSTKTIAFVFQANSKLVMGYDGTILAGIDFTDIKLQKDDAAKKIWVTLPNARILSCELDLDSFKVYEEDVSKWNMISAEDYNGSLQELEARAKERALERGILQKATDNAELLVRNFIVSLVGAGEYSIVFID